MATPGLVTSNVAGGAAYQSVQDQAAAYNLQKQMKEDKEREWARAAEENNARMAQAVNLIYKPSSGKRPLPTWTTGSTVAAKSAVPGLQSPIRWLDPDSQTVGWDVERATKNAIKKGEQIPMFLMGHNPSPQI